MGRAMILHPPPHNGEATMRKIILALVSLAALAACDHPAPQPSPTPTGTFTPPDPDECPRRDSAPCL